MTRVLQEASALLEEVPKSPPMSNTKRLPDWTCLACGLIMENYMTMRMKLILKRRPQGSMLLLRWCQAPPSP